MKTYDVRITYLVQVEAVSPMEAIRMVKNKEVIIEDGDKESIIALEVKNEK